MEVLLEAIAEKQEKISSEFSEFKNVLVDMTVELSELKKHVKNSKPLDSVNSFSSFETSNSFLDFNFEIERDKDKFNEFMNVLETIYSNNQNEIRNDLSKYFNLVLRACFGKQLINELSWNKYKEKFAIGSTRVFQAIQLSGVKIDGLSTEFDRLKILRKQRC